MAHAPSVFHQRPWLEGFGKRTSGVVANTAAFVAAIVLTICHLEHVVGYDEHHSFRRTDFVTCFFVSVCLVLNEGIVEMLSR